jgi:hypothetical protein
MLTFVFFLLAKFSYIWIVTLATPWKWPKKICQLTDLLNMAVRGAKRVTISTFLAPCLFTLFKLPGLKIEALFGLQRGV